MRLLWIREPWLSLIESGAKLLEHRPRSTSYRGPVVLCSSKQADTIELEPDEPPMPYGALGVTRCLVELVDCHEMTPELYPEAYPAPWHDFDGPFVFVIAHGTVPADRARSSRSFASMALSRRSSSAS